MSAMSDFTGAYVRKHGFTKYRHLAALMALVANAIDGAETTAHRHAVSISAALVAEGLGIPFADFKQFMELSKAAAEAGEDPQIAAQAASDAELERREQQEQGVSA